MGVFSLFLQGLLYFTGEHGSLMVFLLKVGYHPGGSDHPNGTTVSLVSRAGRGDEDPSSLFALNWGGTDTELCISVWCAPRWLAVVNMWDHHHGESSESLTSTTRNHTSFFLWWGLWKIHSLSNFQTYSTLLLAVITRRLSILRTHR